MADVWLSSFSTTPVVTLAVLSGNDTFRGGGEFVAFTVDDVLDASRDETLLGAALPVGWTHSSSGSAKVTPTSAGIVMDTGPTPGSSARLDSPDADYVNFDAAVDVDMLLPVDAGPGEVDIAVIETVLPGSVEIRVGFRRGAGSDPTQVLAYGEVTVGGVIVESGARVVEDTTKRLTLRLVRAGQRVYGLFGERNPLNRIYSSEVKVFSGLITSASAGPVRVASRNLTTNRVVRARLTNYTVESHASINGRLLNGKFVSTNKQIRGFVPAATLAEVGKAEVSVFGLFGSESDPQGFEYILPPPKTVGNGVTNVLRTYGDRQVRDT